MSTDFLVHLADILVVVVSFVHRWGRNVEGTPPDLHLSLPVFLSSFCLIQPRQATVVALVEPPGPVDGQPHLVDAVQDKPQGPDGPLKDRGVADIKLIASI